MSALQNEKCISEMSSSQYFLGDCSFVRFVSICIFCNDAWGHLEQFKLLTNVNNGKFH